MPTSYEIHPAIGIARLGSSELSTEEGYFLGPEPGIVPPSRYRDPAGFLKRQAARFRIFRCERTDRGELLDADEVFRQTLRKITWTVHLVNRKGAARRQYGTGFRNKAKGNDLDDRALIIDPGPRSVSTAREHQIFDSGMFRSTPVKLGEITMDDDGRLLVLGGHGRSGSDPSGLKLTGFRAHCIDNHDWYDDIADGPVVATIELSDGTVAESHAWVIVGPPDFAPGVTNLVTLYDVLVDRAVSRGLIRAPTENQEPLSFSRHVKPTLERAVGYRWVNRHAYFGYHDERRGHGHGHKADFSAIWEKLADPSPVAAALRASLAGRLRNPDRKGPQPKAPPLELTPRLSDGEQYGTGAGNVLPLTRTQYQVMQAWAAGNFVNDLGQSNPPNERLPDALDRAALEACVGGALFPGIEVNFTLNRDPSWFMEQEPFRLSHAAVRPGELTQYNALPWQADFQACQWQEFDGVKLKRLGWWPAQRPDDVFTGDDRTTMHSWTRGLGDEYQDMVDRWDRLGMVVDRGSPGLPFFVEDERDVSVLGP